MEFELPLGATEPKVAMSAFGRLDAGRGKKMARKGSWQVHAGDNTRSGANREKKGGNHMSTLGTEESGGGSCFL